MSVPPHEKTPTEVCPEAIFIALLLTSKLDALYGETVHPYSRRNRRANKDELERKREQNEKRERVQLLCQIHHTKKHRHKRCLCGGAGVVIDEHPSFPSFPPSKASSISSSGILSMLKGFLLALIIIVKWSSYR